MCSCTRTNLKEIRLGFARFPIVFRCKICGKLYTCKCFHGHYDVDDDILRLLGNNNKISRKAIKNIRELKRLCHLCNKTIPAYEYGSKMYYTPFERRYLPYIKLFENKYYRKEIDKKYSTSLKKREVITEKIKEKILENLKKGRTKFTHDTNLPPKIIENNDYFSQMLWDRYFQGLYYSLFRDYKYKQCILRGKFRELVKKYYMLTNDLDDYKRRIKNKINNDVRKAADYPVFGNNWLTERALFQIVRLMFHKEYIYYHYRGRELKGLELDIWIPKIKLGIEYQGEQHYKSVEHWGGIEGLKKLKMRDKQKRILCKKLGYKLIEFTCKEKITPDIVESRLNKYLRKIRVRPSCAKRFEMAQLH